MNPRIISNSQGNWSIIMPGEIKPIGNYDSFAAAARVARMNGATDPIEIVKEQPILEPLTA